MQTDKIDMQQDNFYTGKFAYRTITVLKFIMKILFCIVPPGCTQTCSHYNNDDKIQY